MTNTDLLSRLQDSLAQSLTDRLAAVWLEAPGERDSAFFKVYSRVSIAVQKTLRAWLPRLYLSNTDRYRDLQTAFALLVYRASLPFRGKAKYELNYDFSNALSMTSLFRRAARQLPQELSRVEALLRASGSDRIARYYHPMQGHSVLAQVRRKPEYLNSLLAAETSMVNAFVRLGCAVHEARQMETGDGKEAIKEAAGAAACLVKTVREQLRRLCGRRENAAMVWLLLWKATKGLQGGESCANS